MKNRKTAFAFILLTVLAFTAYAQQYDPESDFRVARDSRGGEGVMITQYLGKRQEVNIPPKIQNQPVTGIGEEAFRNKQLTSITIPNSVIVIGKWAFQYSGLTSVIIPYSVTTIEQNAFCGNRLTSVTIPNSVTSIGSSAFFGNIPTSVTIEANVVFSEYTFGGLSNNFGGSMSLHENFLEVYNNSGKSAGTYTRPTATSTTWTK